MNFAWFSATSRFAAVSLAVSMVGATVWTGCGSSSATVCDDAGLNCQVCDGYGCSSVQSTPTIDSGFINLPDARSDAGKPVTKPDAKADAGSKPDAAEKPDAKPDVFVRAACGTANGGPCACTTSATCASGQECVAGACTLSADVCDYSSQCGAGTVCANNQCVAACSSSTPCATGFTCTNSVCEPTPSSSTCTSSDTCPAATPFCVSGSCVAACSTDSQCATGDYCDQGACVLDTRPSPDCTTNANCLSTQVCQSGFCLYTCTTAMDCELTDTRIPVCADGVCRSTAEANPACTTQAQCNSAQDCIGNICQ